jgi:hypothetical protein
MSSLGARILLLPRNRTSACRKISGHLPSASPSWALRRRRKNRVSIASSMTCPNGSTLKHKISHWTRHDVRIDSFSLQRVMIHWNYCLWCPISNDFRQNVQRHTNCHCKDSECVINAMTSVPLSRGNNFSSPSLTVKSLNNMRSWFVSDISVDSLNCNEEMYHISAIQFTSYLKILVSSS